MSKTIRSLRFSKTGLYEGSVSLTVLAAGLALLWSGSASAIGNIPIPETYSVGTVTSNPATVCSSTKASPSSNGDTAGVTATSVTVTGNLLLPSGRACATLTFPTSFSGTFYVGNTPTSGVFPVFTGSFGLAPNGLAQPKYHIVGVFYAPPCSSGKAASTVVYGNSDQLKIDDSLTKEYTQSDSVSLANSFSWLGTTFGVGLSYGWSESTTLGTDIAVTTTSTENYTFDGCLGVDGVNHNYDIVWIWLNPVLPFYDPPAGSSISNITVLGIGSDDRDTFTMQTGEPDVVALSVVQLSALMSVLKANETPTAANTGINAGTLEDLQRSWDTTWPTNSGDEPGPGLVAADLQDILNADPFVANAAFNPATSTRYAVVNGAYVIYDATATPTEYSYVGQATDATTQTAGTDDQHYVSVEISDKEGGSIGPSVTLTYNGKWLWDTKSQATTTNTSTQTATFNIWTPAASYTGPAQLAIYWDTVYESFVFYPIQ